MTNTAGVALDGMKTGQPGDNYYGKFLFLLAHAGLPDDRREDQCGR